MTTEPLGRRTARAAFLLSTPPPSHGKSRRSVPGRRPGRENGCDMSDFATLETSLLSAVSAAPDEAALEALRIAALGKQGSVSALLKTLGSMTPDERKEKGPLINGLRDRVQGA